MKRFVVIGGQYSNVVYGSSDTLHGAKCLASKNEEYWDNWKGFHKPAIYLTENIENGIYKPEYEYNREMHKWEKYGNTDF